METDRPAIRAQVMSDPSIINLNTGSFGPLPIPVFERVTEIRRMLAAEPTHFYVRQAPPHALGSPETPRDIPRDGATTG